jgi:tetratricopeptide (TPR) repeat protein
MVDNHYDATWAAFDAAEALLGDNPGEEDDATVDQWLELMLDGRADLHALRGEADLAMETLRRVEPVLQARGSATRLAKFYHVMVLGRVIKNRYRVDETDIADIRKSAAAAAQDGDEKDIGYATYFVGRVLMLHGDLAEAAAELRKSLALAERIGESILLGESLLVLTQVALRRHDVAEVRALAPRAAAAVSAMGTPYFEAQVKGCLAWLAWQDGRPDEVIRLAAQIAERQGTDIDGSSISWVYLCPLVAARLSTGQLAEAVEAGRRILEQARLRCSDELVTILEAACQAWDRGQPAAATDKLTAALSLAHDLHYF